MQNKLIKYSNPPPKPLINVLQKGEPSTERHIRLISFIIIINLIIKSGGKIQEIIFIHVVSINGILLINPYIEDNFHMHNNQLWLFISQNSIN